MSRGKPYVDIRGYHSSVTGSCIRNTVHFSNGEKFRYLVDFGMYQGEGHKGIEYNDSVNPKKINAVLLTHTHLDHDGALPLFVKSGYSEKIYMSKASACVIDIGLTDSYNIMVRNLKKKQPILFSMSDIERTLNQIEAINYEESVKIHENITVTFFNNGHLIGASIILVQIREEFRDPINILYTGDYKDSNIFVDIKPLPSWVYVLSNLTIVTEATYGDSDSSDIKRTWDEDIIKACAENRVVVNAAFGQGRFQELMYHIRMLQEEGKIPSDYPVRVDGTTGIDYTFRYKSYSNLLAIKPESAYFFPMNHQFITTAEDRNFVLSKKSHQIIITTSGMGSHGPAAIYIPHYLNDPNALIYFTGYTSEDSNGRAIYDAEYGDEIHFAGDTIVQKKALVLQTNEFSAHAKADELIYFINQFIPRSVLINHGELSVKEKFEKRVKIETGIKKTGILGMGYVYRVNSYGIDKAIRK